jgi:hypothetical protein
MQAGPQATCRKSNASLRMPSLEREKMLHHAIHTLVPVVWLEIWAEQKTAPEAHVVRV